MRGIPILDLCPELIEAPVDADRLFADRDGQTVTKLDNVKHYIAAGVPSVGDNRLD